MTSYSDLGTVLLLFLWMLSLRPFWAVLAAFNSCRSGGFFIWMLYGGCNSHLLAFVTLELFQWLYFMSLIVESPAPCLAINERTEGLVTEVCNAIEQKRNSQSFSVYSMLLNLSFSTFKEILILYTAFVYLKFVISVEMFNIYKYVHVSSCI